MSQWNYFFVLAGCLFGSLWLEFGMRTRVLRRGLRLIAAIAPVTLIFMAWDAYAIGKGHWWFDANQVTGIITLADIPLEELAFFIVIPLCAVLTFEAVRSLQEWRAGDDK